MVILNKLLQHFSQEIHNERKQNLALIQAAVLLSHHVDYLKKPIYSNSNFQLILSTAIDLSTHEILSSFITYGLGLNFGIGLAIGYLSNKSFEYVHDKYVQESADLLFEELLDDIKY